MMTSTAYVPRIVSFGTTIMCVQCLISCLSCSAAAFLRALFLVMFLHCCFALSTNSSRGIWSWSADPHHLILLKNWKYSLRLSFPFPIIHAPNEWNTLVVKNLKYLVRTFIELPSKKSWRFLRVDSLIRMLLNWNTWISTTSMNPSLRVLASCDKALKSHTNESLCLPLFVSCGYHHIQSNKRSNH